MPPRNSRLAKALKTKRSDIRDPNEGSHPRIKDRAEKVAWERMQGLANEILGPSDR